MTSNPCPSSVIRLNDQVTAVCTCSGVMNPSVPGVIPLSQPVNSSKWEMSSTYCNRDTCALNVSSGSSRRSRSRSDQSRRCISRFRSARVTTLDGCGLRVQRLRTRYTRLPIDSNALGLTCRSPSSSSAMSA